MEMHSDRVAMRFDAEFPWIPFENPATLIVLLGVWTFGVVVIPFLKSKSFQLTVGKIAALAVVLGYCAYHQSPFPTFLFMWPVSLIWFPEYWGKYKGSIRGPHIDEPTPPIIVSAFGWFFLIAYPALLLWISSRS